MGSSPSCLCGNEESELQVDIETIRVYLEEEGDLAAVWERFDADKGGEIDHSEFERILVACFRYFILRLDPAESGLSRTELQPFIDTLNSDLHKMIDPNGDGVLSFDEFQAFGKYLHAEYRKLDRWLLHSKQPKGSERQYHSSSQMPESEARTPEMVGALSVDVDTAGQRQEEDDSGKVLASEKPAEFAAVLSTSLISTTPVPSTLKRVQTPTKPLLVGTQMQMSELLLSKQPKARSETCDKKVDAEAGDGCHTSKPLVEAKTTVAKATLSLGDVASAQLSDSISTSVQL